MPKIGFVQGVVHTVERGTAAADDVAEVVTDREQFYKLDRLTTLNKSETPQD